jgi:hypothetical protein
MIVLPQLGKMTIKTTSKENKTYTDYAELQARVLLRIIIFVGVGVCCAGMLRVALCDVLQVDYLNGDLHPGDVKPALARDINVGWRGLAWVDVG